MAILCNLVICQMPALSVGGVNEPNLDDLILKLYFTHGDNTNVSHLDHRNVLLSCLAITCHIEYIPHADRTNHASILSVNAHASAGF